ncbi:hypothetical protein, partial [uncultured Aquitalea sp.]|uniref:hypothetical protein n=1 Tax=uncultured Aquitalea sp. TaxID=540272 RepID=UPI0025D98353
MMLSLVNKPGLQRFAEEAEKRVGFAYLSGGLGSWLRRFRAADGKGIFAWPKIPFIPKGHPASMACG